jgi:CRP-like cAMP-binding protein
MPAFRGLPHRHFSHIFSTASLEVHPAGTVIATEGEPGESMLIVVGGEVGLFQKDISPKVGTKVKHAHQIMRVG